MNEPELRALIHYLAEYDDEPTEQPALHFCNVAMSNYEIEFYNDRSLDRWIYARQSLLDQPKNQRLSAHTGDTVEQLADRSVREGRLLDLLLGAVRSRLNALKSK
jgi:hypothetical protein